MPVVPRTSLQQLLYGPAEFAEHEELQAFQYRFLAAIALVSVGFNLALAAAFWLVHVHTPQLHKALAYWCFAAVLNLLLWAWLRRHPRRLKTGSLLIALIYWCNLVVPTQWLAPDPLQPMWTLLLVLSGFIMLGRKCGWLFCAVALATSWWQLRLVDLSPFPDALTTMVFSTVAAAVLGHTYVERFDYLFSRLSHHNAQLLHLSTHDALTQALNARAYYEQSRAQLQLCQRLDMPASVLFVDLDHFKRINDTHGHAMGDHVLRQASLVLHSCLRGSDLLGRVGGEEFSVFLPNTTLDGAAHVAERMRSALESLPILFNGQVLRVTASIGVSCSLPQGPQDPLSLEHLQQHADRAMYQAKHAGRNQVACEAMATAS